MKLSIVIPALNEEKSIEDIIKRTLYAREHIIKESDVTEVEVIVVSDGSTDRTVELASKYLENVHLIVFKKNYGYGAAIKKGWDQAKGDLLGFLDADGTCDPNFFTDLCNIITEEQADIAIGCRINSNSKMPLIRKLGNIFFSFLLSFVSSQKVKDTASGMRVVKKSCLPKIMPLPDGLHFTPAMSARAVLNEEIKIIEKDMSYKERAGTSKLKILQDGIRFLKVILQLTFLYRPNILLSLFGVLCLIFCFILMIFPAYYYILNKEVLEWMIYRFILTNLLGILSTLFFSSSYLTEKIIKITLLKSFRKSSKKSFLSKFFNSKLLWITVFLFLIFGISLVFKSFTERFSSGLTYEHWSRYLSMTFLYSISFILIITKVFDYILNLVIDRQIYLQTEECLKSDK